MTIVDMYKCTDSVVDMEQSLKNDGIIGIHGGRLSTRRVLDTLMLSLNTEDDIEEEEDDYFYLTYNHPETELGYAFDTKRFELNDAKAIVLRAYEEWEQDNTYTKKEKP